ncbi:TNT domain-containing protein [Nocardia sp. NPDC004568]|uniref:TNT domain-containing protein n=1 Tax=Nocardia sp. NPDC004568 TaxID=3154551 RepID=UPI00339FD19E
MSEPQVTPAAQERYVELLQQIGGALIGVAPVGWRRIDLIARIVAEIQDVGLTVIMSDWTDAVIPPPPRLAEVFAELRSVMYVPERGAWLSARYTIDPPGAFQVFYNYEHDPLWDPPISPAAFQRDLETYPRPVDTVPAWLRPTPGPVETRADRTDLLGIEGQRYLTRKIADLLVMRAPADRQQIRVMYRAAGDHVEVTGHILGIDGRLREWEAPSEVAEFYRQLRTGMYKTGVGTWTEAATIVEYPIRTSFEYRSEAGWHRTPPRWAVLDELELFPRTAEHVPAWMKTVLPNAERVAEVAGRFRRARIFDHRDSAARPVVNRPPVAEADVQRVLHYLDTAYAVIAGRGFDPDLFDPAGPADVPTGYHTDGTWIWTASVPHYLAKHGIPPEPDLVAHIRANQFTPPQPNEETKAAVYLALTGENPTAQPQRPALAPIPDESDGLSPRERRTLDFIRRQVSEAGAIAQAYRILDSAEGALCLERVGDEWQVADYERGKPRDPQRFARLWDAGAYLLGSLTLIPSRLRVSGVDRNTAPALNDWPIQPLPTEPPLTLLTQKRMAVLMPGRIVVRYGPPAGNLTFSDGTDFSTMSLRPEREQQGPHRYRIVRELRTLSGHTVPWHNQPGGGTAYLLPKSITEHLADGSITDSTDEPTDA